MFGFYPNPENRADSAITSIASYSGEMHVLLCNGNNAAVLQHLPARARTARYVINISPALSPLPQ